MSSRGRVGLGKKRYPVLGRCAYCNLELARKGRRAATRDHVVPKSKGGTGHPDNIKIVCHVCNMLKGDMSLEEFYQLPAFIRRRDSSC